MSQELKTIDNLMAEAEEAYFKARPQIDTTDRRRVFESGFRTAFSSPDPRDEVIEKCRVALESMGVLATAIFDGEFNEAPTLLLYVVGKTLLGVNEALAAIKALEGK